MTAASNGASRAVAPDVHSVRMDREFIYVESAGLSLHSFGALEANQYEAPLGLRTLSFRLPRMPRPAPGVHAPAPLGIVGVFVTGVPIYNPIGAASWRNQNLWHEDAVAASGRTASPLVTALQSDATKHSPIIGFALDGYPIYGPFGWDAGGRVQRVKSSYRLRSISTRAMLPDGTLLTPGQEGPPVGGTFPLGTFAEDYEFVKGSGDLDEYNGRFARTPDYPDGAYAYFLSTWPYTVGPRYFGQIALAAPARVAVHRAAGVDLWVDRRVVRAREPVNLTLMFRNPRGAAIRFLEIVHEQPVHLIVVSKDLAEFAHIHPAAAPGGGLSVTHAFMHGGVYTLYADYTAPGAAPAIARFDIVVVGPRAKATPLGPDLNKTMTVGGVQVTFSKPARMKTGEDLPFSFTLTDAESGQPLSDLEPWLGSWGHIMIASADRVTFIHAHSLESAAASDPLMHVHSQTLAEAGPSTIRTITGFRRPGIYKIWLQFQRRGEVFTVPWEVAVSGFERAVQKPDKALSVAVSASGFSPARLAIPAGEKVQVAFTRLDAQNCAREVIFPALGIRKPLGAGQTVLIDLPALQKGEMQFGCGMGMFRGALVVQ